ncbi:sigma factor-like helix-turn-helix DNA-binding protein [Sporanaerobacter acetigenes]|uniref:sigma factor-like helix-turn-helix DNA-binding protein n=1 Tax=Sporanaerobacter acetigenes TaxID=165813 RepID=UPI003324162C
MYENLNTYMYRSIKYLKILNEMDLEFVVYKLLKNAEMPMNMEEIADELFFINEIDMEKLGLILNCYDCIHFDGKKYYYSEEEKSAEDDIANIMYKIKYVDKLDLFELVFNLLCKSGKPLHVFEIRDILGVIVHVDEQEVEEILSSNDEFTCVGYKTYALSSWEDYEDFCYDLNEDILKFKKKSKIASRNWELFKRYKLGKEQATLQEIGDIYGVTRERVRQVAKRVGKKIKHPCYKNQFRKYIFFVQDLIYDYGVLCLKYKKDLRELEKIFTDWDIIEAINLLNLVEDKFIVVDNVYIYTKDKYEYILNYLDYIVEKKGKKFVGTESLDNICVQLNIEKWREKEFLKSIIYKDKRFYINESQNSCYFTEEHFDRYSILYIIFQKIGEPVHYSVVMEEYIRITGKETNLRLILSYLDRRKDLFVRTFTGIYGLKEWGVDEHIFVVDLVVELLEEKQSAMHYHDIYECIKEKTLAKERTVYTLMQLDERISTLGHGFYGLASQVRNGNIKYYSNIVDAKNNRRLGYLLGKNINEYGNIVIAYRLVDTIINSYSIKIPKIFNIYLNNEVCVFDKEHNKYSCSFNISQSDLYGVRRIFKRKELVEGDIIILEFISSNIIRIFTKYEYENEYEIFDHTECERYIEPLEEIDDDNDLIEVTDMDSLLKFGLKNGFVYYEDLKSIDISEKYSDVFEMMVDFSERGINFLNKD